MFETFRSAYNVLFGDYVQARCEMCHKTFYLEKIYSHNNIKYYCSKKCREDKYFDA